MTQLFGIPIDTLTTILLSITGTIVGLVLLLALSNLLFFKIGIRNIPRRRTQMFLIIFALMLSTTLLSSVLATGDVINAAVQSVAIYNLGNVDEIIQGGHGALGFFPDGIYYEIRNNARSDPDIAAVGAALVENNLLVADETSRQVRSKVTALGIIPGSEQGFGGMQNDNGKGTLKIADLSSGAIYLNHTAAQLLNAHTGDIIYLYSQRWPGQRYAVFVQGIIANGGLVGETPYILSNIKTIQNIEQRYDDISAIFISNRGGGGVNGLGISDRVSQRLEQWIPGDVHVIQVKQQGVQNSQKAQDIFSRVFALFCLFALAIGLLLIFLIFVLLAAERRAEMGMARAIGVQRRQLVLMFLFEGTIYDLLASFVGLGIGVGVGALLVTLLGPILARFNFPLKLTFQLHSLVIAYCLGVIFTFGSVALSSWLVSRMTVVEAMRDLPEQERADLSLGELTLRILALLKQAGQQLLTRRRRMRRILFEQLPDTTVSFIRALALLGFLPLLAGYQLMRIGLDRAQIVPFSLGLSLLIIGAGLLCKAILDFLCWLLRRPKWKGASRLFAGLTGLALTTYWALPFDILARLGLPRFAGGIEVFFVAGFMMVLGATWALLANAELFVQPLVKLCSGLPGLYAMARLASAYPLHRRFRTGLSVIMFSLVVFAMTVMAIITNAMQNTYTNIDTQTGGYDIQAVAYFRSLSPNIQTDLASHGINPDNFSAIGVRTATQVGVIQLSADQPRWQIYPAQIVSGGFLDGFGLHLTARAYGFNSDAAVWQALQTHSNYALIDSSALPYRPNSFINSPVYDPNAPLPADAGSPRYPPGFDPSLTFSVSGVYQGDSSFPATPIWVAAPQANTGVTNQVSVRNFSTQKFTIIGVVDNSDNVHFGLYLPGAAYPVSNQQAGSATPEAQTYYFKVAPGQDKRALSLALGSALLDNGLETTVLEDAIWQTRGPRILLSNVLLGVVGLTLLLGVAALAITGTRAVVERRQQIGLLRAIGTHRRLLQGAFLFESFLVGALGSMLGIVLGVILSSNIFAANFFEQFQTGLVFAVPWEELALIIGVALLASLLSALLPAWQVGRVAPAEALRYH